MQFREISMTAFTTYPTSPAISISMVWLFPLWNTGGSGTITQTYSYDDASQMGGSFDVLISGSCIRYTGIGMSGNGTGATGGFVTNIQIYNFAGTVLQAELTNISGFNAVDLARAAASTSFMGNSDTINGSSGKHTLNGGLDIDGTGAGAAGDIAAGSHAGGGGYYCDLRYIAEPSCH
jgi:hypothetical protein